MQPFYPSTSASDVPDPASSESELQLSLSLSVSSSSRIGDAVKDPSQLQIKDCEADLVCPKCRQHYDNSQVSCECPGFPAAVKFNFDPSDEELLQHLATKCGVGSSKPHAFIDEVIPTLAEGKGICYTHPEDLPGMEKDGSVVYFLYKRRRAYTIKEWRRWRIKDQDSVKGGGFQVVQVE